MRTIVIIMILVMLGGCSWNYNDKCNVVYCRPELKGKTEEQVIEQLGEPLDKTMIGNEYFWIYEVPSFWKLGASGKMGVKFENGLVTTTKFLPATVDDKMFSIYDGDESIPASATTKPY
ncbi:MAG: hypothetical protein JW938_06170 [Candidatus Omnitrophica bacterium]|nr:hypothetical protein [Candidatus Omnitrophota bacterium]